MHQFLNLREKNTTNTKTAKKKGQEKYIKGQKNNNKCNKYKS